MKNKGITLIALVVTIVVLLILAGISISALTNTGIFQKAKDAKQKSENAALDQNTKLDEYENEIDKYIPKANSLAKAVKVGDYVAYTPDKLDKSALDKLKENLNTYRLVKIKFYKHRLDGVHEAELNTWIFHPFYN